MTLDAGVIAIALEAMDPHAFENFGQLLLAESLGIDFEPTGGVADGGQDGFLRARSGKPTQYIQISKERDVRSKVRRTLKRLKESGRELDTLTFLTSEFFPVRDLFESEIEKELGIQLKIHDKAWIVTQVSLSEKIGTILAERAAPAIRSAHRIVASSVQTQTASERLSVLVYMDAHARSAPQETDLLTLATDAAIYQSLEGTDPEKRIFRSEDEIRTFVNARFPASKSRSALDVGKRLKRLSEKTNNPAFDIIQT